MGSANRVVWEPSPRGGVASGFRRCVQLGLLALIPYMTGCTSLPQFVRNGFKVGPDYERPPAPVANNWIDASDPRVKSVAASDARWWTAFGDPVLNDLIHTAYAQNVSLRVAGTRVLEARAQQAIAVGQLFPQQQTADGSVQQFRASRTTANAPPTRQFATWAADVKASWELDFWGKIRRTIESADAAVDASVDDYDNVMVTLIGDLASAYVQYRIAQQKLAYTRENIRLQKGSLKIATDRWKAGQANEFNVVQATSLLEQLESTVPALEIGLRQANNQMCILLGLPPTDLADRLAAAPIPVAPAEVVAGVPADLIRRRPDVRAAERLVAAQSAQVGVAEADLYPAFFLSGSIGYQARTLGQLFGPGSVAGAGGPGFQWNILNYGRIINNVRFQDFKTQELVGIYQQKVLSAAREVEDGIVAYLRSRQQAERLAASVQAAERAVALATAQYNAGAIDYTSVFVAQQFLADQQTIYAQALGDIDLGLIATYRALGGGWELRLEREAAAGAEPAGGPPCNPAPAAPPALGALPADAPALGTTGGFAVERQ